MPALPPSQWLEKFEAELTKVGGSVYRATIPQELEGILETILGNAQDSNIVLSRNPLLGRLRIEERLRGRGKTVKTWPAAGPGSVEEPKIREFFEASFAASAGITGVDFALAETGSLVLTSDTEGSQLASLAPPVHVALYLRSQLVGSLEEVLEKLAVSGNVDQPVFGRSVVFITGTSRTGDIEQILIRGVHGPGEIHAILVEDSCL